MVTATLAIAVRRVLVPAVLVAALAAGCGSDSNVPTGPGPLDTEASSQSPLPSEPETSPPRSRPTLDERTGSGPADTEASSQSPLPSEPETSPPRSVATLDELRNLADQTIAMPRMSFELDVMMTLPGSSWPIFNRRTGSFDDETFSGVGTRWFETEEEFFAEAWGDEPFQFRFLDETFWTYNPIGDPPVWGGVDVLEFIEYAGGDPLGSVDGDAHLGIVVAATVEVLDVQPLVGGAEVWTLLVRADELVSIVAAGGPAARMVELGAADSGLMAELTLRRHRDGYFSGFSVDLDEWFTRAVSRLDTGGIAVDEMMRVEFVLEPFDDTLEPEAPCTDPSTRLDEGLTILLCEP